jgi:uncharacterized protein (UPF0548 family)
VFRLTRPSADEVAAFLASRRGASFSYAEVGATRAGVAPAGYVADRTRVRLGTGRDAYVAAVAALRAWRMTTLGWATLHPAGAAIAPGVEVAMVVRHLGVWSLNPCRLVYVDDNEVAGGARRTAFAYGTLPSHAAAGEERFAVEWDAADDAVWYDLSAFSRPAHPLVRLGRPFARRLQRRFARDSAAAMVAAVRGAR